MRETNNIPKDLAGCEALIRQQQATIEALKSEMETLRGELRRLIHGGRSERRIVSGPEQQWLPFENEEEFQAAKAEAQAEAERIVETYTVTRKARSKKRRDETFPSHLPRIVNVVDAPEERKNCEQHGARELIGYDITETLVHEPPKVYVIENRHAKYACVNQPTCGIVSPERPTGLVEGNRYDTSVAATVIDAKWSHYIPIYRQQDLFAGSGWIPSRSTLQNLVNRSAFVVEPLISLMTNLVKQDMGVGIDDTSCRMLLPQEIPEAIPGDLKSQRLAEKVAEARAKKENSLLAKMWVYSGLHAAPYNIFDFRVSRHRDGPEKFFATSRCKVQGDCFSGTTSVVLRSDERLEFVACWSHARRKVVEAQTYKEDAETLLGMIKGLYDIETRAASFSWEDRQALRARESTVVLRGIRKWLDSLGWREILPKSDFAEAIRYIENHWEALQVYVTDGRIPIDNNAVERLMKQVALGRKAWLFVCGVSSGEQSAMMMSLVSSAKRHDLDTRMYVKDVLDQLLAGSTDYESLLPDVWKQSHPEAIRVYREEERRDQADRKQYHAARRRLEALCPR